MIGKLFRFGVVGGGMTLLNYGLFIAAIRVGAPYLLAAGISWVVTVTAGYGLNRRFTFRCESWGRPGDLASYIAGYAMQFAISLMGLQLLMGVLRLGPSLAFALNLVFTAGFSFCYMQLAVFRGPRTPQRQAAPL